MLALLSFSQYPCDLSIAHMSCFVHAARETDFAITPALAWLTSAHRDALLGLDAGDHRRRALEAATTVIVDMGSPNALGQFALDKQAALAVASAPRRKEAGHGFTI